MSDRSSDSSSRASGNGLRAMTRGMNPWRGLAGLPRAVWVLSAATLVNRSGTMFVPFLVLYLTRARGYTPAAAGARSRSSASRRTSA